MQVLVTGCAGFIGSTLSEELLKRGHHVVGVDSFSDYYPTPVKQRSVERLERDERFSLLRTDLSVEPLDLELLSSCSTVFHLAGQPGVRKSWNDGFQDYLSANVQATQLLLESICIASPRPKFVYASSSSVYGNDQTFPVSESDMPRPHSPYGVTKLAGEHLCNLYARNFDINTVSLRFFTVFGPRQRPDMAFQRIIQSALTEDSFPIFGDGSQVRDFTYVDDIVSGLIRAADTDTNAGLVLNLAGGSAVTLGEVIESVEEQMGVPVPLDHRPRQPGDPDRTGGTIDLAFDTIGWAPTVDLATGLRNQITWQTKEFVRSVSERTASAATA